MSDNEDLKNVIDDPRWKKYGMWLYYRKDARKGAILATSTKPEFANFALNCGETERLRNGRSNLDSFFAVAMQRNDVGKFEYRGHKELDALYENRLRHRTPIIGAYGPFWSLLLSDFDDEDAPF